MIGVLDGKMYNRAVRVLKCACEALMHLAWGEFIPWVKANHSTSSHTIDKFLERVEVFNEDVCQSQVEDLMADPSLALIFNMWNMFLQYLQNGNGQQSSFWMSYIYLVGDVMLGLIRASREGNWSLHCQL